MLKNVKRYCILILFIFSFILNIYLVFKNNDLNSKNLNINKRFDEIKNNFEKCNLKIIELTSESVPAPNPDVESGEQTNESVQDFTIE